MAHFAYVVDGVVERVHVLANPVLIDEDYVEQEAPALVAVEDWVTVTSETLHHQPTKGLAVEAETITLQGPEVPVL